MRLRSLLAVAPVAFVALVGSIGASREPVLAAQSDSPAAITSVSFKDHVLRRGREIFRFDTFGDEQLWTGFLRMQEPLSTLSPETALSVGLKVDSEALPRAVVAAIKAGQVDLTDPAVTLTPSQEFGFGTPSPLEGPVPAAIAKVAGELWPGLPVIPFMSRGASDSRFMRAHGIPAYGVSPIPITDADARRAHGIDERIPATGLRTGIEFLHRLVLELAGSPG